ncbi:MAG TPA: DUF4091 domain-containing protein [Thermogutta sp.]|nr:DUF4091 domain-containing protein [Thermogutta sp.]
MSRTSETDHFLTNGPALGSVVFLSWMLIIDVSLTVASEEPPAVIQQSTASVTLIPNPDFREGDDSPSAWKLSNGAGHWLDRDILEIEGRGQGSSYWYTNVSLQPGSVYLFRMVARQIGGGSGCVITGPATVNHDYRLTEAWREYSHIFRMPDEPISKSLFRLGQWEMSGRVQFDKVELLPVLPIHARNNECVLGQGESIRDGIYSFEGTFDGIGSNDHRVLHRATARFNTNRWVFSEDEEVVYKFQLPETKFLSGQLSFAVNYATGGTMLAEVSPDGTSWTEAARQESVGVRQAELPASLFPTPAIFVRLRHVGTAASMQVDRIEFRGKIDRHLSDFQGITTYGVWRPLADSISHPAIDLHITGASGSMSRSLAVHPRDVPEPKLDASVIDSEKKTHPIAVVPATSSAQNSGGWTITLPQLGPGQHLCRINLSSQGQTLGVLEIPWEVNQYYRADYGELLSSQPDAVIWWCEADWKIPRDRPPPSGFPSPSSMVRLTSARNDYESVQVVISPQADGRLKSVEVGLLRHPSGATIAGEDIKVSYVYYHYVHTPTDKEGVRDWWPDALPPCDSPLSLVKGQNQPLWLTVHVAEDKPAGDYTGQMTLTTDTSTTSIPISLHVWNFALPKRNHLETAFGFDHSLAFRYHNVKTEEDQRRLLDLYFEIFSEHRISPYNPTPLDPFVVRFDPQASPPSAKIDFSRFDRAMEKAIEVFHFTNFQLPIRGMGGGTFHSRYEPEIAGYGESTPEYQVMFASQVQQIEAHLREKGWLNMAYVYWFDEPDPKDYEFVRKGMDRLKKYAPQLRRLLTEEPVEPLYGAVDIWCPVTPNYNHEIAESRRKLGERFWWYVCTGPKAPYCTLFIDHPATELRVWLWQTWQRGIDGILVWSTNYWTSSAAFPDGFQDPYEDPMGYVSGYSTPKGVRRHWGNGDGRFIYPPLSASVPGKTSEPVIAKPVSSIRWEMLREGIEDYEMLWLLRDLLRKKGDRLPAERRKELENLLAVPPTITTNMTTFAKSPKPIYEHRSKVAEAIEKLSAAEP